ncbi:MAG: hypothetical protein OHK0056_11060 [Bacteriovoracaceae bacterium]
MTEQESAKGVWALMKELETKKGITEVVINGPKHIFVERAGQFIQLNYNLTKNDIIQFSKEVAQFNKKPFDQFHPIVDGNLPDGSRINIINEPFAYGSPSISIRKYLRQIKSFDSNPGIFGLETKWVDLLKAMVSAKLNIIVSGGTGVGKTTMLNMLLREISAQERVITIEDTLELQLELPNLVRLEARNYLSNEGTSLTIRDLVKNTLRMRPDRIIIGESRGGELFDLLQAMNTGHDGSMSSIHSNSPGECISRMETLFLLAGYEIPIQVVRKMIASAVDVIIQISRNRDGERVVTSITEITGMEGPNILTQQLATLEEDKLIATGLSAHNMEKLHRFGGLPMNYFS